MANQNLYCEDLIVERLNYYFKSLLRVTLTQDMHRSHEI